MFYNNLIIFCLVFFQIFILNIKAIAIHDSSSYFYRKKHKKIYDGSNKDFPNKNIDFYIPEHNSNQDKSNFYKINELNDTNFNFSRIINRKDIYVLPYDLIRIYEKAYTKDKIDYLITKTQRNQMNPSYKINEKEGEYPIDYIFYSKKDYIAYDNFYTWPKLVNRESNIIDYSNSPIQYVISTSSEIISIESEVNKHHSITFKITNPGNNNLIIKEVKTDMYQIKLYPYIGNKHHNYNYYNNNLPPISSYLPFSIYPSYYFIVQLSILPDLKETIKGTLYIEFNNKQVYLLPIFLTGIENKYKTTSLYYSSWELGKLFSLPIKIHNPYDEVISIKKINYNFKLIEIHFPNGELIENNFTNNDNSLLDIQPHSTKNVIYIRFLSNKKLYEYGILSLIIEKDTLLIPILINAESNTLKINPSFINFGICDITNNHPLNIKKLVPIYIKNVEKKPLKIFKVYLNYDEKFLQFHYHVNKKFIIIEPLRNILFGHLIFNPQLDDFIKNLNDIEKYEYLNKIKFGSIYIETNSTNENMIQLHYSYYLDSNTIQQCDYNKFNFVTEERKVHHFNIEVKLNPPFGLESNRFVQHNNYIKLQLDNLVSTKIKNPMFINESYYTNISITSEELAIFKYERYYYYPLFLNFRLYSIVPFKIDNNNIDLIFCDNFNSLRLDDCLFKNKKMREFKNIFFKYIDIVIDVGILSYTELKKHYFYIVNENTETFKIKSIETNNNFVTMNYEGYDIISYSKIKIQNKQIKKLNLPLLMFNENKVTFQDNELIEMFPYSAIKFSYEIFPEKEGLFTAEIIYTFSNNKTVKIILKGYCYKGKLHIGPSIVRFDPAFPGLIPYKIISSKSTFSRNLTILDYESTNNRIIPKLITKRISPDNRTLLMKIIFDPLKSDLDEDFMIDINPYQNYITYKELFLWKEKNKLWERCELLGKTEINANITISTEINDEKIRVKAFLTKPSLIKNNEFIKNNEIDLNLIQIGQTENIFFDIYNPSDVVMGFKIMLASEEFSDVNNNSMFDINDEYRFNTNKKILIMKCYFQNKGNMSFNYNPNNNIIIEDYIDINELKNGKYDKMKLIRKLIDFGNDDVKKKISETSKIICKYKTKFIYEILLRSTIGNKFYMSKLFSKNFTNNIPIIVEMTDKKMNIENKNIFSSKKNIFKYLFNKINSIFIKSKIKQIKHQKITNQSFFLDESVSHRLFTLFPGKKYRIGPIKYHPFDCSKSSVTLFIKNNLTILYPIKIKGQGGNGNANFINFKKNSRNKKMKLINNSKLIIDIDKDVFENEMINKDNITRTITLSNNGTLPLIIKNISIENSGCEGYGIKILQCDEFDLIPNENIDIDIMIIPDFIFYNSEKEIFFYSEYQKISLKIIVNIQKDILSIKNQLFLIFPYKINFTILSLSILVIIIRVIIIVLQKEIQHDENKKEFGKVQVIDFNTNEYFIYENLFIKCYKKEIKGLNEDLIFKQIDKLNDENISNLKRNKRKRSNGKNKKERESDVESKKEKSRKESINSNENEENKRKISNLSESSSIKETKNKNELLPQIPNQSKSKKQKNKKGKTLIGMEKDKDSNNEDKTTTNDYTSGYISANNQNNNNNNNYRYNELKYPLYNTNNYYHIRSNSKYNSRINKRHISSKSENSIPFPRYYKSHIRHNQNNKFNIQIPNIINGKKINNLHDLFSSDNTQRINNENYYNMNLNNKTDNLNNNENIINKSPEKNYENKSNTSTPERIVNEIISGKLTTNAEQQQQKEIINFENESGKNFEMEFQMNENEINPIFLSEKRRERESMDITKDIKKNISEKLEFDDLSNKNEKKLNYDSSNEDFNFNINKIISESNTNVNIEFSGNELTDEELKDPNTQMYFKRFLNSTFEHKVFYSDPFSHTANKGKLGKLLEEKEKNESNKIIEKEDEEWSDEDDDDNDKFKFKLNEMDLDFNLNFK